MLHKKSIFKWVPLAATAIALAACDTAPIDTLEPPLAGAAIGGDMDLIDETGAPARFSDYDGSYRMIYFGYTYCPDICPYDVQRMARGYEAFKEEYPDRAAQIVPIFVSVDYERDTAEVVAEFTDAFSPDMIGFTGSEEQIAAAAKAFGVFYAKGEEVRPGAYLMDHSRAAFLMGRQGEPIALLPVDESAEGVTEVLRQWVN